MLTVSLLFVIVGLFFYILYLKKKIEIKVEKKFEERKKELKKEVLKRSRYILKGKISEQMTPITGQFKYNLSDARFIGSPIDYIIFDGYSNIKDGAKEEDINLIFADVKTGKKAKLNKVQKKIKKAIDNKRIEWKTINIGD